MNRTAWLQERRMQKFEDVPGRGEASFGDGCGGVAGDVGA